MGYRLPEQYLSRPAAAQPASPPGTSPGMAMEGPLEEPLWQRIWRTKTWDVGITAVALVILTGIFFFPDQLLRRRADGEPG